MIVINIAHELSETEKLILERMNVDDKPMDEREWWAERLIVIDDQEEG